MNEEILFRLMKELIEKSKNNIGAEEINSIDFIISRDMNTTYVSGNKGIAYSENNFQGKKYYFYFDRGKTTHIIESISNEIPFITNEIANNIRIKYSKDSKPEYHLTAITDFDH